MASPRANEIIDGYRFRGGDPSLESSWEKADLPKSGDIMDGYSFKGGDPALESAWEPYKERGVISRSLEAIGGAFSNAGLDRAAPMSPYYEKEVERPKPNLPPKPERTWGQVASDTQRDLAAGPLDAVAGLTGLARRYMADRQDKSNQALREKYGTTTPLASTELVRSQPGEFEAALKGTSEILREDQSDARKYDRKAIDQADGAWEAAKYIITNPSALGGLVAENLITTLGTGVVGGAVGKAAQVAKMSEKVALTAATVSQMASEGVISAGTMGNDIEALLNKQGITDPNIRKQAMDIANASGLMTGYLSRIGAGIEIMPFMKGVLKESLAKAIPKSMGKEFTEELTQGYMESVAKNLAIGQAGAKDESGAPITDLTQGAFKQGVIGGIAGAASGGMMPALSRLREPAEPKPSTPEAPILPDTPIAPAPTTPPKTLEEITKEVRAATTTDDAIAAANAIIDAPMQTLSEAFKTSELIDQTEELTDVELASRQLSAIDNEAQGVDNGAESIPQSLISRGIAGDIAPVDIQRNAETVGSRAAPVANVETSQLPQKTAPTQTESRLDRWTAEDEAQLNLAQSQAQKLAIQSQSDTTLEDAAAIAVDAAEDLRLQKEAILNSSTDAASEAIMPQEPQPAVSLKVDSAPTVSPTAPPETGKAGEAVASRDRITLGSFGKTPKAASPIELVKNDQGGYDLYQNGQPALDYETANPITYAKGMNAQQILVDVKSRAKDLFGNSGKFYQAKNVGVENVGTKPVAVDGAETKTNGTPSVLSSVEQPGNVGRRQDVSDNAPATVQFKDLADAKGKIKTFANEKSANLDVAASETSRAEADANNSDTPQRNESPREEVTPEAITPESGNTPETRVDTGEAITKAEPVIPPVYAQRTTVKARVLDEDAQKFTQEEVSAQEAIRAYEEDIETLERVKLCVGGG